MLVKVLSITGGKDPDEYIRSYGEQGPVRFKQLIEQSGNDVEYRLQKLKSDCDLESSAGKVQYLNGATELLSTLDNRMEQEIYAGKLSQEIGVERATVMMQVEKLSKRRHQAQQKKSFGNFSSKPSD